MSYEDVIFYNGDFINTKEKNVNIPIEERGFQFGDGIYEVFRIYDGNIYTLKEHLIRLYRSLAEVKISIRWDINELSQLLIQLVEKNDFQKDGQVYLQVTRGSASRNHLFPKDTEPNIISYVRGAERPFNTMRDGVEASLTDDIRWLRCDIKSLNLLGNVLAKQEAADKGCYEAILHRSGKVTECSSSNVYLIKDNKIYTHPADNLILDGITRLRLRGICEKNNIDFIEEAFYIGDIYTADEMFLTSTTSEITPIVKVNGDKIGKGEVGTLTRKLQNLYEKDAGLSNRNVRIDSI